MSRPRITILCNYSRDDGHSGTDSTTHAYGAAIEAAGGVPVLVPCLDDPKTITAIMDFADGVIVAGGPDVAPGIYGAEPHPELGSVVPERDELDRRTVEYLLQHPHKPSLSICRGIQSLNVFPGGTLIQDITAEVDDAIQHTQKAPGWHGTHELQLDDGSSRLADALGARQLYTNSFHHQAVDDIAAGFSAVAHTSDGVVEAIEHDEADWCIGVQWHPELMTQRHEAATLLFEAFVEAAQASSGTRSGD